MILTIDFETKDEYIGMGYGAGWPYPPSDRFKVLGAAVKVDKEPSQYITTHAEIASKVAAADTLVMHNAQYDLGCLEFLGIPYKNKTVIDTMVMGRLYDSSLMSYSLDNLASKYLGLRKDEQGLADAVYKLDLLPYLVKEAKEKEEMESIGMHYARVYDVNKLIKYAKSNMEQLQELDLPTVAKYANKDTDVTRALYDFYAKHLDAELYKKFSYVSKICVSYRKRGVRIDKDRAVSASRFLAREEAILQNRLNEEAGFEVNVNSNKQIGELLDQMRISYERTAKGNPQITSQWLEDQDTPILKTISEIRSLRKIRGDFIDKLLEMQEMGNGRVFPELNLLQARTGRFSSSNPNIQQIPGRDPKASTMCRSLFLPEEGEKWFSLDYSNQEGRLQIHYADLLKLDGSAELVYAFKVDPNLCMHWKTAKIMYGQNVERHSPERDSAKTLNHGISYGMGTSKLAKSLGVDIDTATHLKERYLKAVPYLEELDNACKSALKTNKYIKTLGGRKLRIDPPIRENGRLRTFEYRALNKLIQGSAADQIIEAMIQAYKEDLPVLFPVHDQICMSGTRKQAERMKEIMETCVQLAVPSVADGSLEGGNNWAEAGH